MCSSVCAFVEDYVALVQMFSGTLRPGGLFVQWDWELNPDDESPFGLSRENIASAYQNAGLNVIRLETAFTLQADERTMEPLIGVGQKMTSG